MFVQLIQGIAAVINKYVQISAGQEQLHIDFVIEWFSHLSSCCLSSLVVRKTDHGDFDSLLPALSVHHDKWSILESIMDTDVGALIPLDIELSPFLIQAHHQSLDIALSIQVVLFFCFVSFLCFLYENKTGLSDFLL